MTLEKMKKILDEVRQLATQRDVCLYVNGKCGDWFAQAVLDRLPEMQVPSVEDLANKLEEACDASGVEALRDVYENIAEQLHPLLFPTRKVWGHPEPVCKGWPYGETNALCVWLTDGSLVGNMWSDGHNYAWAVRDGDVLPPVATPEPATLLLLGSGAIGMLLRAARRRGASPLPARGYIPR